MWPILQWTGKSQAENSMNFAWSLPIGLILASFGWWETFVTNEDSPIPFIRWMAKIRMNMIEDTTRYFTYLWISVWKPIVFFGGAWLIVSLNGLLQEPMNLFNKFIESFDSHAFNVTENMDVIINGQKDDFNSDGYESRLM